MKAIIIDDEYSNIENVAALLKLYCPAITDIKTADDIDTAVDLINVIRPDILFLDIQLGERTAFDLLKLLTFKDFEVIFITAFDKYGIDAIKLSALDYLLKPVSIPELMLAVNKVIAKQSEKEKSRQLDFLLDHLKKSEQAPTKIALPQLHEVRYVLVGDIVRCEADNSYTTFYFANGEEIVVSRSIKEYSGLLKPLGFLRTHQSHLVNSSYITSWVKEDGGGVQLSTGKRIPVSRPNKELVIKALSNFLH